MKYPVLIAACNEAQYIGQTLDHLDPSTTEPLVLVNGSTDSTADIARHYGATVLEFVDAGKLPAIQQGLKYLGDRALEPVLFTDADSYPLFPSKWARAMGKHILTGEQPSAVSGIHAYHDGPLLDRSVRSARRYQQMLAAARSGINKTHGLNMGINIGNREVLDEVLELPHVWPGEDRMLIDLMVECGGTFTQTVDIRSMVMTSTRYMLPLRDRLLGGSEAFFEATRDNYVHRSAPSVVASYIEGEFLPVVPLESRADL